MNNRLILIALICATGTAAAQERTPPSATLDAMRERLGDPVGPDQLPYQLYLLWPRSRAGTSKAYLPPPASWSWASKGSLNQKLFKAAIEARLNMGVLRINSTKYRKGVIKAGESTLAHTLLEHDPAYAPADPLVAEWLAQIKNEYGPRYNLYVLWPRWLSIPVGWRDAFQYGGSLLATYTNAAYGNMELEGQIAFTESKKNGRIRTYRILERAGVASP